jgi:hypothetical protein
MIASTTWRDDATVAQQRFRRVGRLDVLAVGKDHEPRFMSAARGLPACGGKDGTGLVG